MTTTYIIGEDYFVRNGVRHDFKRVKKARRLKEFRERRAKEAEGKK